jgi:uncharacterized iron-regulated protein
MLMTHIITRLFPLSVAASLVVMLSACVISSSDEPQLTGWEHPLTGRIWDVRSQRFIDQATLVKQTLGTEYLLLGERHDNPVHHQHQTWFIRQLRQHQRRASVAFEMIDQEQGNRLAQQPVTSAEQMIKILDQTTTSWQYETRYKAQFSEALAAGYRIDAANLDREQLMNSVTQGEDNLPPAYRRLLGQVPLTPGQWTALRKDIKQSHCDMLDDQSIERMAQGQRLRDVIMADTLLESRMPVKVLITGIGHARNDRGVPGYLGAQASVLSVGFIEVESGLDEIAPYSEPWDTEKLPFDLVWFTPQVVREDLCEKLRQHIKRKESKPTITQP